MRTNSLRRKLRDAWRQERSSDRTQQTTVDLVGSRRIALELDRMAAQATALHLARTSSMDSTGDHS